MYTKFLKRGIDFISSFLALVLFSPLLLVLTILGTVKMKGNPFFLQPRPGKDERIFRLIKFRTMTNEKDSNGKLLPDEKRLIPYGAFLRSTSLDELPELINIFIGDMAIVGPRPQLVRDMLFMSDEHRKRHTVRPGLTGLAQVKGRNAITWEEKLNWDLKYIEKISFAGDLKILLETVAAVFHRDGITDGENATALDYGDELLKDGKVSRERYDVLQAQARELLRRFEEGLK